MTKNPVLIRRGKRPSKPIQAERKLVELMIAVGQPRMTVAQALGISVPALCRDFADEFLHGRARVLAEMLMLLFKAAQAGHVTAITHLLKLSKAAERAEQSPRPPKLGKKEIAQRAAEKAGHGTEWGALLDTPKPPRRPN